MGTYFDKKANILAAVIVGTVLLAGGAILLQQMGSDESKVDDQQRITAEADSTMRQAIALGINDWLKNGLSNQNKIWYSTGALPPNFDESKDSLNAIVNKKVVEYMDRLRQENNDYFIDQKVSVNFNVETPLSDDHESMNAIVTEFKVGLESDESSQIEDISTTYSYPYKAWLMYENLNSWMMTNADGMTQHLEMDAIKKKSCQLVKGTCTCDDDEFSPAIVDSIKLTENDVTDVIDARIETLNNLFTGTGITCDYTVDMMNIQNTEKIRWAQGDVGPNGTNKVILREDNSDQGYIYELQNWVDEQRTRPKGDGCDGLPQASGDNTVPEDCTVRDYLIDDDGNYVEDAFTGSYTEPSTANNEICSSLPGGSANDGGSQAQSMKVGMLAMDKKLAILMTISCEDKSENIETPQGLEPLSAEIRLRFAIAVDCPIPTRGPDMYADEELYGEPPVSCPGGSCFPAGTQITMADGSKKAIEDVRVGEWVLSYNTFSKDYRAGQVIELESPVREGLYTIEFKDGSSIEITNEHPLYTTKANGEKGWASIVPEETYKETKTIDNVLQLELDDSIMREDKSWALIVGITYNEGTVQTYNLKEVSTYDNFFADELLAHNKCCFAAGTPITMGDGSEKAIEDVNIGDFVMTYNEETGKLEPSEVFELQQPVREGLYVVTFENGKILEVTNDHPLYTNNGWAAIEVTAAYAGYALDKILELNVGDKVLQDDMTYSTIVEIVYNEGDVQTYTLKKVAKNKNFFANGFLAHNQKLVGYVGLACDKDCPVCTGCAPADGVTDPDPAVDSDWQCVEVPNLICGKCGLCDTEGECTIPQYAGYPCFDDNGDNLMAGNGGAGDEYNDCYACDGLGFEDSNCVMNPPEITNLIPVLCDGPLPCSTCNGNGATPAAGGCDAPLNERAICNDDSIPEIERVCLECPEGAQGACAEDSDMEGEPCDDCTVCESGVCQGDNEGATSNCETDATPCMSCSDTAGVCIVDQSKSSECNSCQMCGTDGSCVEDPSKNDVSCGTCSVCSGGECIAGKEGQQCASSNGCISECQSGSCTLVNEGASCTRSSNTCNLNQRCTSNGCETTNADQQKFCCGSTACDQGSPCCTYTNKCEPCPSTA
jgi:hypothetical protein